MTSDTGPPASARMSECGATTRGEFFDPVRGILATSTEEALTIIGQIRHP